jgi:hypothetical protein
MAIRVLLASLASAVVLFLWGFIFWSALAMMVSPWKPIAAGGDPDVIATLRQSFPESGVYMYPWVDKSRGDQPSLEEEFARQHAAGPFVQIVYHANGVPASEMGKMMGWGFAHMFISAALCCVLLAMSEPLCCYGARVCFVFGLGVFATLWIEGANLIWWHHPSSHVAFMGTYNVVAWLLAGLVIGAIVKKPKIANATGGQ